MELEMDCLTLRRLLLKVCSYKCQFCTNVRAFSSLRCWSLTSSHDGWAKCKDKVPDMCQIPIKMLKQEATPNSVLHNLKIYLSKGYKKTSQR